MASGLMNQIRRYPLLYRYLVKMSQSCSDRVFTGYYSKSHCCKSEGNKVFRCVRYNREPAMIYDCVLCKHRELSEKNSQELNKLVKYSTR